jgi:flagellin-like hook-associated protein FlgL
MTQAVTLTAAMRANLLSLQTTGTQLGTAQLDLSTGNKVNSALDNPVNFFAAQSLNSRASALSGLLDNMGQAVSAIQATNQGITNITALVNQLTSITNSATQNLANITTQNVLETTSGNSVGPVADAGLASTVVADLTTAAGTMTLVAGGTTATFTVTAGETLTQLVNQINAVSGLNASIVYGDGTTVSAQAAQATGTVESVGNAYLNITSTNGSSIAATGTGTTLAVLGLAASSVAVAKGGDGANSTDYNSVLTQINALVTDTNYQGTNLIDGNHGPGATTTTALSVNVNELSTNAIAISGVDLTTNGNALNVGGTGLGLGAAGSASLATTTDIANAQTAIKGALSTLQTTASGFANSLSLIQTRQDFTTNLVNTLQDGASQLTIADKNQEGADLLALQTQQQLGIEALSLSSQANQSVLRLFA